MYAGPRSPRLWHSLTFIWPLSCDGFFFKAIFYEGNNIKACLTIYASSSSPFSGDDCNLIGISASRNVIVAKHWGTPTTSNPSLIRMYRTSSRFRSAPA